MSATLQVCQKLIEGDVTLETLGDWYAENRTDAFDGNTETELAEEFANIPDHVSLELDVYQDEEDKRQHETFVHNMEVMKVRLRFSQRCSANPRQVLTRAE